MTMNTKELLVFLEEDEQERLAPLLEERELTAGADWFVEGGEDNFMAFIVQGRLAVKKTTEFPGKSLIIALLGVSAPVGESGLLADTLSHGATVTAVEDSRLAVLSRSNFEQLSRNEPHLAIKLLSHLLAIVNLRLQKTSHRLSLVL